MIRLLDAAAVRQLLPMKTCIALMREAFRVEAEGRTVQPIRQGMPAPNGRGVLGMMPGALTDPNCLGIKVLTIFPGNFGSEFSSHQGLMILFDPENGRPIAIMDATEITAIRTAAATAVATDILACEGASTLSLFGYGEQAVTHLKAICAVRDIQTAYVWGRDFAKGRAFADKHADGLELIPVEFPAEASQADILCCLTAASEPFLVGAWLRPGQHINAVGSSIPTTAEIDVTAVARSRTFVDFEPSARALAGDLRRAVEAGATGPDHVIGSVGQVLTGAVRGRTDDQDITLFKSLGMVAEDLVAAGHILRRAEAENVGVLVSL